MPAYCRFVNEPLPYSYQAMEPYIDIQTMYLHHDKHLQTYIDHLNALIDRSPALQSAAFGEKTECGFAALVQILKNLDVLADHMKTDVRNNAGGVFNHWFYFNGLSAHPKQKPQGTLAESIHWVYGSFAQFQTEFTKKALDVFGSGYAWLVADPDKNLTIIQTENQDTPITQNQVPVLCIDVWEHAYYLKHYNLRKDYVPDWFAVANWDWAQWCYSNPEIFLGNA
ncbi:MAG: superoxide dismutase [Eubacterium sp.]|nr:superoxide dismutase [Eubacterium sp.]